MDVDRSGQAVEVEVGLEERAGGRLVDGKVVTRTRRARTRFVDKRVGSGGAVAPPPPPTVGGDWCPLTVRARLQRVGWVLAKDPRVGPRRSPKSCMPEPVREVFKDLPGEPMRIPVPSADQDAVSEVLKDLLRFRHDDEARAVVFSLAEKMGGDDLGKLLHCSDTHARKLQKRMLDELATAWNGYTWRPDARDIERAKKFIHRNIK